MGVIRGITLDLDDTLWAIAPVIIRAEEKLHGYMAQNFPRAAHRFDSTAIRDVRMEVAQEYPELAHDLTETRRLSLARMLEISGYDASHSHELMEQFFHWRHAVDLYPDVEPALEMLSSRLPIVALTNGNADVARVGIGRFFAGSLSARTAGVGKPDPKMFLQACSQLDCAPNEVVHVGDHPDDDVIGAMDAGMKAVWVNRHDNQWPHERLPHGEVKSLTALASLI